MKKTFDKIVAGIIVWGICYGTFALLVWGLTSLAH